MCRVAYETCKNTVTEVTVFPLIQPMKTAILPLPCNKNRGATHSIVAELMIPSRIANGTLGLYKLERATTDRSIVRNALFSSYQLWLDYFASSLAWRQPTRKLIAFLIPVVIDTNNTCNTRQPPGYRGSSTGRTRVNSTKKRRK